MSRPSVPVLFAILLVGAGLASLPSAAANETLFFEDFESGAAGWTPEGLWHLSTVTGSTSFWYGQEDTGTYETGTDANAGRLYSPVIDLTAHTTDDLLLTFREVSVHEQSCFFERPIVAVSVDGGAFTVLSDRCTMFFDGTVSIPLSDLQGTTLQFSFLWDTRDDFDNGYFGWSIDDVTITTGSHDLTVLGASAQRIGDAISLSATIGNEGTLAANGVSVAYTVFDSQNVALFGSEATVDTMPGAAMLVEFGSFGFEDGDYTLQVTIDPSNAVPETDETDNTATIPFTVLNVPDLEGAVSVFQDETGIYIETTTFNLGSTTTETFTVGFRTFDAFGQQVDAGATDFAGVEGGGARGHVFGPAAYVPGPYTVEFTVDVFGQVTEADETDNVATTFFQVTESQPDLIALHEYDASVPSGDLVTIEYGAGNQGAGSASDVAVVVEIFDMDGNLVAGESSSLPPLCSGCAAGESFETVLLDGAYLVVTTVDPSGALAESDEGNNVLSGSLFVGGSGEDANLVVASFEQSPDPAFTGDIITATVEVANIGGGMAGTSELGLFVLWPDGTEELFAQVSVPSLAPGGSYAEEVLIGGSEEPGVFELRADADLFNAVEESSESDNSRFHTLVIFDDDTTTERANLVAEAGASDPASEGEVVLLQAVASNDGEADAGAFLVELYLDGALMETFEVPGLGVATADAFLVEWVAEPGFHVVDVVVDSAGSVAESNEADNIATWTFFVEEAPKLPADLAVAVLGVDRSPVRTDLGDIGLNPLGRRTVEISACNIGDLPLSGGDLLVTVESAAPKDAFTSSVDLAAFELPALDGGECATFHARWDAAGSVGDVDIVARGSSPDEVEGDATNDVDVYEDFVLVGGFGGVALI